MFSYVYDTRTLRVRQTEASFAGWEGLDTLSKTVTLPPQTDPA
jgi:hypothetical protein